MSNVWGLFTLDVQKVPETALVSVIRCKKGIESYSVGPVRSSWSQSRSPQLLRGFPSLLRLTKDVYSASEILCVITAL
jgi:hypothetical protein